MLSRYVVGLLILRLKARRLFLSYELKTLFLLFSEVNRSFTLSSRTGKLEPEFASGTMYSRMFKWHTTCHHNYSNFNQPHLLFASLRFPGEFAQLHFSVNISLPFLFYKSCFYSVIPAAAEPEHFNKPLVTHIFCPYVIDLSREVCQVNILYILYLDYYLADP